MRWMDVRRCARYLCTCAPPRGVDGLSSGRRRPDREVAGRDDPTASCAWICDRSIHVAYKGGGNTTLDGIPIHRFRYFFRRWENLTHEESAPDRMRRSLFYTILPAFYLLFGSVAIWRLQRREQYDIVHVHWPLPHALFGWVARAARRRTRIIMQ